MISGITNADSLPVLERMLQFAGGRHRLILHNIANLDTPGFRPEDVDTEAFRARLGQAIDERREKGIAGGGPLDLKSGPDVRVDAQGLRFDPQPVGDNLLFHDGNDRDLERTMQSLAENFLVFRTAADLMRNRMALLRSAIQERP